MPKIHTLYNDGINKDLQAFKMESSQYDKQSSPKDLSNRFEKRNMVHIKLLGRGLNNEKESSLENESTKFENTFGKDEAMKIPRIQNIQRNDNHMNTSQSTESFVYENKINKVPSMRLPRITNKQVIDRDITSPITRDLISHEDKFMKIPRVSNKQENGNEFEKSVPNHSLINQITTNNEFRNDEVLNHSRRREINDRISHDQESRLYSFNKSAISLNEKHNDESFKREFIDRKVMDEINKRKSLQGTWPKCNEKLTRNDTSVFRNEKKIYKGEKANENDNFSACESDKDVMKISQEMKVEVITSLNRPSKTSRKMYEENSAMYQFLTSRNSDNDILYTDDKLTLNSDSLNDKCDQFSVISDSETRSDHHEENELKNKQLTNEDNKSQILAAVNNGNIGQEGKENNQIKNENGENEDKSEIGKDENQSSREIHMKALSELQTSSALRARPDVVYGTMIPEPDYSDEEVDSKSTNTSSPNTMVVRNNRVNTNGANNSPQKENKCNPNERFDDKGLILPKKLPNPCKESTEKKSLHRELLFTQKVGINVLNQKSELQKALEKHKGKQALKEQEKEKQTQLTPLQKAIDERAQRLEKSAKEEEKEKDEKDEKDEKETSSEFQKIHAKFRSKIEAK